MRLFLLGMMLFSINAFSKPHSLTYRGQKFNKENIIDCEKEFKRITQKLESIPGFFIFGGGCLPIGMHKDLFEVRFNYERPHFKRITNFKINIGKNQNCQFMTKKIEKTITQSKNTFIASFCEEQTLKVHYINDTISMEKAFSPRASFATKEVCKKHLNVIHRASIKYDFQPLLDFCRQHQDRSTGVDYYNLRLIYLDNNDSGFEVLTGKVVHNNCLQDSLNTQRSFDEANIKVVHHFCSDKTSFKQSREYIVYLNTNTFMGKPIKLFSSDYPKDNLSLCQRELDSIKVTFEKMGRKVLYSFCEQERKNSFSAKVYYKEKK